MEIQGTHYRALAGFVRATGCHAGVPISPLAPVSTAEQTVPAARLTAELAGLGPIAVVTGTADLLLSDSHRLRDRGQAAAVEVTLTEAPGMPHDYPLMPTPEGAAARREIAALLR